MRLTHATALTAVLLGLACRRASSDADAGRSPLGGSTKLELPSQCRTALLETTSCRGEDTSFQECHYFFRAEGIPRAELCRAFMNLSDASAPPAAGSHGCNELSPSDWRRVPCADYKLPGELACFACSAERHEESRQLLQAFAPACDRAIVLKGCNVDITKP